MKRATLPDLIRARLALEPQVAAEAALCANADDAYHRAIAGVTGHPVLVGLLSYLLGARRRGAWQRGWDRTYQRIGAADLRTLHSDQHERIVDAIAASDPAGAGQQMKAHLETIAAAMPSGAGPPRRGGG